jgi:hypothetical protein
LWIQPIDATHWAKRSAGIQALGDILPRPLRLLIVNDRLAPSFTTAGDGSQSCLGTLADWVALELTQSAEYLEYEPPNRRSGDDAFGQ